MKSQHYFSSIELSLVHRPGLTFSFGQIPKWTTCHLRQLGLSQCPGAADIFGQFVQKVMMLPGCVIPVKSWPTSVSQVKKDRKNPEDTFLGLCWAGTLYHSTVRLPQRHFLEFSYERFLLYIFINNRHFDECNNQFTSANYTARRADVANVRYGFYMVNNWGTHEILLRSNETKTIK